MPTSVIRNKTVLSLISAVLFWFSTTLGNQLGREFGLKTMIYNFGEGNDLYPVLYAYTMIFTGYLFAIIGIIVVGIFMHQIGRRLKVAVGKPTFYGFLLYLLTLLILILNFNRTH